VLFGEREELLAAGQDGIRGGFHSTSVTAQARALVADCGGEC
jgi:hypothetical protein